MFHRAVCPGATRISCTLRWTRSRVRLSLRKATGTSSTPTSCTGNPGDHQVNIGLGTNRGANGPEVETRDRYVRGLLHPHARLLILNGNVVVRGEAGIASQKAFHVLLPLQLLAIDDFLPVDPGQRLH